MSLNTSAPVSGKGVLRKVTRFDGGGDALQKRIIHHPDGVAGRRSRGAVDPRRLRLKGLIYRKAGSTRCYLTPYGLKVSLFLTLLHARLLRPGFAGLEPENPSSIPHPLRAALHRVDQRNPAHARKRSPPCKSCLKTCLVLCDFGP